MNDSNGLHLLARHNRWANQRLYEALEAFSLQGQTEVGFDPLAPMRRMLNHIRVIGLVWQAHLTARPHGFTERIPADVPSLAELKVAQSELDHWYEQYVDMLAPAGFEERIRFTFIGGGAGEMSRLEILLHVSTHNSYHRGFIAQLLYDAGSRPPTMDLPVFVRDGSAI